MIRPDYSSLVLSFVVGLIFGLGLTVSQMISPEKILNFLDLAGNWDPSLLFVMTGALAVTFVGYRWALGRPTPILGERFQIPTRTDLDLRLLVGAALFGIGWGLGGYCPGPAVTALGLGDIKTISFVVSMLAGMITFNWVDNLLKAAVKQTA